MTSARPAPTNITMMPTPIQPHIMTAGPPVASPNPYSVRQPDRTEITEKELAKFAKGPIRRFSTGV
ncbi:hypothetical protein SRIMM317S_03161 [Streptomyces rimosus subsp. rimosus]